MKSLDTARVALVHDWLTGMRGGEKCLEVLCQRFPNAPLHTLLHAKGSLSPDIEQMDIRPSWLNRLPGIVSNYRYTLPLMPFAADWPIRNCDLLVSFSHAVAKAAKPPVGVPHVSYCFTPMRYAWHMRDSYFAGRLGGVKSLAVNRLLKAIRNWDRRTSSRVTHFIAISKTIQDRIRECYGRESVIIYPPADTAFYSPDPAIKREDFYLIISAFAPYKRLDLAIEACKKLNKRLIVIGSGQDAARLRAMAGPTVEFLGWKSNEELRGHLRRCRALLFPGEEDFGIVPVEANACGTPVIAFAKGGATETVTPFGEPRPTGFWFAEQTVDSLASAIETCEREHHGLNPADARAKAEMFDKKRYEQELLGYLAKVLNEHGSKK
ncbi:glycosyltransferase [Zavarzinella formosa]|uniref:glycosyltransferase n=1 Tax=Zavarzinella formosa TaxID=360055 RepID=UPI000311BCB8|nr:glycosyltransferase [Zavarzinella formosa]